MAPSTTTDASVRLGHLKKAKVLGTLKDMNDNVHQNYSPPIQSFQTREEIPRTTYDRMNVAISRDQLVSPTFTANGNNNNNNRAGAGGGVLMRPQEDSYGGGGSIDYNYNNNNVPYNHYNRGDYTTISSSSPGGQNSTGPDIIIRGEEVGIVLVVLILWVGAIVLFFNRWGKIRMLEPYQPKFCEHHNPNCPMADPIPAIPPTYPGVSRTFSKFNLASDLPSGSPHFSKCNYHGVTASSTTAAAVEPLLAASSHHNHGFLPNQMSLGVPGNSMTFLSGGGASPRLGQRSRPRQNSVFVTSPNYPPSSTGVFGNGGGQILKNSSRKTKSAIDLSTLVLCGDFMDNVRRNSKNSITNL